MADLAKQQLAVSGVIALTGLAEHGVVKIGISGNYVTPSNNVILVEQEIDDDPEKRGLVYQGPGPAVVVDYVGTKLWITNKGAAEISIRIGQA